MDKGQIACSAGITFYAFHITQNAREAGSAKEKEK